MNRILVIAFFFPPDGGAGTQRSLKLCKYLPAADWKITVLTKESAEERTELDPVDNSLTSELGPEIEIRRIPLCHEYGPVKVMQEFTRALQSIVSELHRELKFDLIYLSLSPYALGWVGYKLQQKLKVPVVLDIRDPWVFDGWNVYRLYALWVIDYLRMKKSIGGISGLITNTPEAEKHFKKIFRKKPGVNITHITNGYDADDFAGLTTARTAEKDRFVLTHTGFFQSSVLFEKKSGLKALLKRILYYRPRKLNYSGRTAYYLLKAVRYLKDTQHKYIDRLAVHFVGLKDPFTELLVKDFGLEDVIRFEGYVTHRQSVQWLLQSDGLFIPLHDVPRGEKAFIVPGKLYEYLAAGKPVLGALPPGDAQDFIHILGGGYLAPPCDHIALAAALDRLLIFHFEEDSRAEVLDMESVKQFERRNLALRFSAFFKKVIENFHA